MTCLWCANDLPCACEKKPFDLERELAQTGFSRIAGVDEAGRGALAGPVVAAAVVLKPSAAELIGRVTDSKKLSPAAREELFDPIHAHSEAVAVGIVSAQEIDRVNILQATLRAMKEAIEEARPDLCLIDGNVRAPVAIRQLTIVKGDLRVFSIAAASIVAKVTRDRMMDALDASYPDYGFLRHKGYGTADHIRAIRAFGASAIHRKSFHLSLA